MVHARKFIVQAQLFLNRTIGELMFDGYEDELVTIGDALSEGIDVPMEKFGWFYKVYLLNFSYYGIEH